MSKKDYILIAKIISETFVYDNLRNRTTKYACMQYIREIECFKADLCRRMAIAFGDANGRFSKDRFYEACGIPTA